MWVIVAEGDGFIKSGIAIESGGLVMGSLAGAFVSSLLEVVHH